MWRDVGASFVEETLWGVEREKKFHGNDTKIPVISKRIDSKARALGAADRQLFEINTTTQAQATPKLSGGQECPSSS